MANLSFTKQIFIQNINQYVYKHNLFIISCIDENIRCFKVIKYIDSIKSFEEANIEPNLTCELLTFDSFYYFVLNNLDIFDIYKPDQSLFKLLLYLNSFKTIINFYEDELDDNNSLFIIDII